MTKTARNDAGKWELWLGKEQPQLFEPKIQEELKALALHWRGIIISWVAAYCLFERHHFLGFCIFFLACLVSNLERKNTNWHIILERFLFPLLIHPVSKLHCTGAHLCCLFIASSLQVGTSYHSTEFLFWLFCEIFTLFFNISVQYLLRRWEPVKEWTCPNCFTPANGFLLMHK